MSKISFCITSMNRLEHIKKTLPINIADALSDHYNIEFILLDYNSADGIENWVKENLSQHIDNQLLTFFRTIQPQSYHRSHSRNMVFRLASGDILVNLDADNFIGKGFVKFIRENMKENNLLAVDEDGNGKQFKDALGRVCVWKKDFERISGYDERMAGYGFEDLDFKTRLTQCGIKLHPIKKASFLKSIHHDNISRIENESVFKNIYKVAVHQIEPFKSRLYLFYKNNIYEKATILDNVFRGELSETIEVINELHQVQMTESFLGQYVESQNVMFLDNQKIPLNDDDFQWFNQTNIQIIQELIYTFSASKNKKLYFENKQNKGFEVNLGGYGKGEVVKNFKEKIVL
jgi:hypothetical protein